MHYTDEEKREKRNQYDRAYNNDRTTLQLKTENFNNLSIMIRFVVSITLKRQ